jgi:hypothetical protein
MGPISTSPLEGLGIEARSALTAGA